MGMSVVMVMDMVVAVGMARLPKVIARTIFVVCVGMVGMGVVMVMDVVVAVGMARLPKVIARAIFVVGMGMVGMGVAWADSSCRRRQGWAIFTRSYSGREGRGGPSSHEVILVGNEVILVKKAGVGRLHTELFWS